MEKNQIFQIVLLLFFGAFFVIGIFSFVIFNSSSKDSISAVDYSIDIWGTVPRRNIDVALGFIEREHFDQYGAIRYIEYSEKDFLDIFTNELASGRGPDLIILKHEDILNQRERLVEVSYDVYPRSTFESIFINPSHIFLTNSNIFSFPLFSDPLVVYYNTKLQSEYNLNTIPTYWDELTSLAGELTQRNGVLIDKSAISLGGTRNIENIKEILSTLILQLGGEIVLNNGVDGGDFRLNISENIRNLRSAVDFYSLFSNPTLSSYTWNDSLPDSLDLFVAGDLLFYIGFASEYELIKRKNPNLDFQVTSIFKTRDGTDTTFNRIYGLSIPNTAKNKNASLQLINTLTAFNVQNELNKNSSFVSTRKDVKVAVDEPLHRKIFENASFFGGLWYDSNHIANKNAVIFGVSDYISGKNILREAADFISNSIRKNNI